MNTPKLILFTLLAAVCLNYGCTKSNTVDPVPTQPTVNYITTNYPKALPNEALLITGTGFSTDLSKLTVKFNNMAATVISATATELNVEVPATAQTGKITVTSDQKTYTTANDFVVLTGVQSSFITGALFGTTSDALGNIYVTNGKIISKVGATGSSEFVPQIPLHNVTADATGNLYTANGYNGTRIIKISPMGIVSDLAGTDARTSNWIDGTGQAATFNRIDTMTTDAAGNLWVSDACRIRKVTPAGVVTTLINNGGSTAALGTGYVDGTSNTARMGWISGIQVDASGNIYTNDNYSIRKITPAGNVTTIAGNGTQGMVDARGSLARFTGSGHMAMDARGNIFITNYWAAATYPNYNYAIRMINKNGLVSTLAKGLNIGTLSTAIVNGNLNTATLNNPTSLTFDSAGNLYVTNHGAGVISKITFN